MKRYLLFLSAALLLATATFAQEEKEAKEGKHVAPPAAAKSAFEKSFAGASKVKWGKEDGDYEVNFTRQGKQMAAVYDSKGNLKETETTIRPSELPASVTDYVKQHYKGATIKEAARITKPGGDVNYEAEVNKTDLIFDAQGKFLKAQKD